MRTATEIVYICDYCNEQFAMEEDCRSCERACAVLKPIIDASHKAEEFFGDMGRIKKFEIAEAVIAAAAKILSETAAPVDERSDTVELVPPVLPQQ
jgi:hypothetical protein